jgi:hypothetical protein
MANEEDLQDRLWREWGGKKREIQNKSPASKVPMGGDTGGYSVRR